MTERKEREHPLIDVWVPALAIFLSAFLLFQVQLILSKYILPWFGGSAAVWTTCMLVYQTLLLGGYIYSHLTSEKLSPRSQGVVHLILLGGVLFVVALMTIWWPSAITPGANWKPEGSQHPVREVILIALVATGLPFFLLSTTGPLLQRWISLRGGGVRTYRLYSISNLGSLLGLLTFPFLLEPLLRLRVQGRLWSCLFSCFSLACGWCAWRILPITSVPDRLDPPEKAHHAPLPTAEPILWVLLSACASSLLLASTNQLCQEVITLPLLWVVPLALYLLSFVLCFDHPRWYRREVFQPVFWLSVFALSEAILHAKLPLQIVLIPLLLFCGCMICHGELVRLKPGVERLTLFYLSISIGGALGGVFVAIAAPRLFRTFVEFQLSVAACFVLFFACLLRDGTSWIYSRSVWLACGIVAGVAGAGVLTGIWIPPFREMLGESQFYAWFSIAATLLLIGAFLQSRQQKATKPGFRFVQLIAGGVALLALVTVYQTTDPGFYVILAERNFYGALRVLQVPQGGKMLAHGRTIHGAQLNPPLNRVPLTYYGPDSGIGMLLRNRFGRDGRNAPVRVGVVGLGTGTLAVYGRRGDSFRYYEIDPQVVDLSLGPTPSFTFIRDSPATVDVQVGDARLLQEQELAAGQPQKFDILVLDAFSGDAIPVHLLTKEAFETYMRQMRDENSVIALHISSSHVNLLPVVDSLCAKFNFYSVKHMSGGAFPLVQNEWVLLGRRAEALQIPGLGEVDPPNGVAGTTHLWTDERSDILRLIR